MHPFAMLRGCMLRGCMLHAQPPNQSPTYLPAMTLQVHAAWMSARARVQSLESAMGTIVGGVHAQSEAEAEAVTRLEEAHEQLHNAAEQTRQVGAETIHTGAGIVMLLCLRLRRVNE